MDGGDDRTTPWMYLKPLNCEHKNDTMAKKQKTMIQNINDSFL